MSTPPSDAASRPNYPLHIGLFVVTCATTFIAGAGFGGAFDVGGGIAFSGTLMTILVCHEMGHFVVARRHGIDASLPYFIPLPPMISLGTMGAVIRMNSPISNRNQLLDVGASGPIAGLVVAIPLLVVGLSLSPVEVSEGGGLIEGNSVAYIALKYLVHGQILPAADGMDVQLHPIAFAAWVGFLITMINLIPIGQLDGGHISASYFGGKHERFSGLLHWALLIVGAIVTAWLALDGLAAGMPVAGAVKYGFWSAMPWLVWAGLLLVMRRMSGGVYHPPVSEEELTPGRKRLALLMLVIFLLIFTPVPLREAISP